MLSRKQIIWFAFKWLGILIVFTGKFISYMELKALQYHGLLSIFHSYYSLPGLF